MSHTVPEPGLAAVKAVVSDTGRGMEPGFAVHAFDAFSQETAEDGERGAGLGLTIVKSIVELMPGLLYSGLSWPVFSMPGTRVYITSRLAGGRAEAVFRNISAAPLNISAEGLMERVTRGDSSRSTQGSGLGLSIAESLAKLQKGSFSIDIDGDLFKAIVSFDAAK